MDAPANAAASSAQSPATGPSIRPLPFAPSSLRGLSERLIQSHHGNNYSGAVKRLHAIRAQLAALDWASAPGYQVNGLKREELVAANSMFLHELYFASLGGDGVLKAAGKPAGFAVGAKRDFSSLERWRTEFVALAAAMGGGSGWALLSWSARESRLVNHWAADHTHLLGGATPILALDMYEHAYHLDFGADARAYVAAFMDNIDWDGVSLRYAAAVEASTASLAAHPDEVQVSDAVRRIDVRRKGAYDAAPELIERATWRDPERVDDWAHDLAGERVVVYCVYGHEVGQSTAARLRDAGVDARYLVGGIEDWKNAGRPVQTK
ncbi:MAG: superoxide dismutase [Betaproteobacteria bacterium]|nr:superoxide dismutase [Betaproteobacteria bacterium]